MISVIDVDIDKIRLNPNQPRKQFNAEKLADLSESIRLSGVLEPVIVRPVDGVYELVAGERRFRASVSAGLKSIPAIVRDLDDRESLEIALIENIQREDISPLECARAYARLMDDFGLTQEHVADRVGKKRSTVANTLRLLNLPQQIQESLDREEITEGHARALLSIDDPSEMILVWESVVADGLSVRDTERISRSPMVIRLVRKQNVARATKRLGIDPNLAEVEDRLRRFYGTKVAVARQESGKGKIEIEFYDDEDLMRILDLMAQI
jgi:ParB family chromosome partitioning protein